ncbi:PEP/pyruvate-binding domain-containing protein [Streptomyces sp. NPDC020875]|uniref:PEP/pyruvate-binding domain-containing protein n=1 Tax=Streptomyces sp. NPDC020875 TaxID=3154898 RepID=UPI0033CE8F82
MFTALSDATAHCGTKAANLARLLRAGFAVPDGFVITDPRAPGWERELAPALRALGPGPYAVRSSALGEDGASASYAGQLHTTLGAADPAGVADAVRRCSASADGARAAAYTARTGGPAPRPRVLVQLMVAAEAAGVVFTRHPVTGADETVIEAVAGLGDALVAGAVTPERWIVGAGTRTEPGSGPGGVLTAGRAAELAGTARRIEDLFGGPQDIEWAIADGRIWILQARPVTTAPGTGTDTRPESATRPADPAGRPLVTGTAAGPGIATGPARVITGPDDFDRFTPGGVLVCRTTSPAWTPLLARAAAVVTETGGMLAHAAIVAREFGIPAVLAAEHAMTLIAHGRRVTVDGSRGTVTATDERTDR